MDIEHQQIMDSLEKFRDTITVSVNGIGERLNNFTAAQATNTQRIEHLEEEKKTLFIFANESKDAIGMLKGAGAAITFGCMIGMFVIGYLTMQNQNAVKPNRVELTKNEREDGR